MKTLPLTIGGEAGTLILAPEVKVLHATQTPMAGYPQHPIPHAAWRVIAVLHIFEGRVVAAVQFSLN